MPAATILVCWSGGVDLLMDVRSLLSRTAGTRADHLSVSAPLLILKGKPSSEVAFELVTLVKSRGFDDY